MLHSGSFVSLGGGDPLQHRDMKGESDKEGFVTSAARRVARGARRQRRSLVHGHHRLVDPEPPRRDAVPLQRARARARVGRELRRDAPVPHGQLRALRPHQRHARRRRHVARARRRVLPDARRQDGHQGRHGHGRGRRRRRSRAHEPVRARADEHREPLRAARGRLERRRAVALARVLGAREGRAVHAVPQVHGARARAAVRGPHRRHRGRVLAAHASRHRRADAQLLAERQRRGAREKIRIRARKAVDPRERRARR